MRQILFFKWFLFSVCFLFYTLLLIVVYILWSSKERDGPFCGITWMFLVILTQVYRRSFENQPSLKTSLPSVLLLAQALSATIRKKKGKWNKHLAAEKLRTWENTQNTYSNWTQASEQGKHLQETNNHQAKCMQILFILWLKKWQKYFLLRQKKKLVSIPVDTTLCNENKYCVSCALGA